jgi:hypothetical protein
MGSRHKLSGSTDKVELDPMLERVFIACVTGVANAVVTRSGYFFAEDDFSMSLES